LSAALGAGDAGSSDKSVAHVTEMVVSVPLPSLSFSTLLLVVSLVVGVTCASRAIPATSVASAPRYTVRENGLPNSPQVAPSATVRSEGAAAGMEHSSTISGRKSVKRSCTTVSSTRAVERAGRALRSCRRRTARRPGCPLRCSAAPACRSSLLAHRAQPPRCHGAARRSPVSPVAPRPRRAQCGRLPARRAWRTCSLRPVCGRPHRSADRECATAQGTMSALDGCGPPITLSRCPPLYRSCTTKDLLLSIQLCCNRPTGMWDNYKKDTSQAMCPSSLD